jgi:hypothetical protein
LDIMAIYGVSKNKIRGKWDWIKGVWNVTNSPYSSFPSFRLYTIAQKLKEKGISIDDSGNLCWINKNNLELQEIELLQSWNYEKYLTDYRLALELRNY